MNVEGVFSGHSPTLLTDAGRQQAALTGRNLHSDHPTIDYIVCSPFERAYETAKIVAKEIGFPVNKIEQNELFIERNFGELEGIHAKTFLTDRSYAAIDQAPNAETIEQLQDRATKALEYVKNLEADNVLVVGHGTFGRAFRRVVKDQPHTDEYNSEHKIGNAEIVELI